MWRRLLRFLKNHAYLHPGLTDRLTQMPDRKELYYLLILTLAVRLPWVFMVPMSEAPDENTHYFIIKYLADNLSLPGPRDLSTGGALSVYVPLPPFGYIPHLATLWAFSWILDPSMAVRIGSLAMAPLMTFCSWWLGRQLFPNWKLCAFAVPLLVIFHPQLVLVHSYANNDATSSTMATGLLCLIAVLLKRGLTLKLSAIIGFLCGWIMLTKYTGYAVLPAVAAGFLLAGWINRSGIKQLALCSLSALGLTAVIATPWFIRNYQLYNGDFMGTQSMRKHWAVIYNKPLEYYVSPFKILIDRKWWRWMFFSYWGMFGYMTRPLIKPLYWTYTGFLVVAVVGLIRSAIKSKAQSFLSNINSLRDDSNRSSTTTVAIWITMFICLLANLTAMILASTGNVGGPQGRYLFTSEVPFLAAHVLGLSLLGKVWGKRLVIAMLIFNVVVYVWSFIMLFPIYGFRTTAL
jgi:4-amino-4-deoxy-L-arabinose transferase-like glycosyltransferase